MNWRKKLAKKHIVIIIILFVGLIALLVLVRSPQLLKSRAQQDPVTIIGPNGPITPSGDTYQVPPNTPIHIKLNQPQ